MIAKDAKTEYRSAGFPHYENNIFCTIEISPNDEKKCLEIDFTALDLEESNDLSCDALIKICSECNKGVFNVYGFCGNCYDFLIMECSNCDEDGSNKCDYRYPACR